MGSVKAAFAKFGITINNNHAGGNVTIDLDIRNLLVAAGGAGSFYQLVRENWYT